jgi:hypothetical protein
MGWFMENKRRGLCIAGVTLSMMGAVCVCFGAASNKDWLEATGAKVQKYFKLPMDSWRAFKRNPKIQFKKLMETTKEFKNTCQDIPATEIDDCVAYCLLNAMKIVQSSAKDLKTQIILAIHLMKWKDYLPEIRKFVSDKFGAFFHENKVCLFEHEQSLKIQDILRKKDESWMKAQELKIRNDPRLYNKYFPKISQENPTIQFKQWLKLAAKIKKGCWEIPDCETWGYVVYCLLKAIRTMESFIGDGNLLAISVIRLMEWRYSLPELNAIIKTIIERFIHENELDVSKIGRVANFM